MNDKWIIAVSGGPDSMALLDMMYKQGRVAAVAHVNYHKRLSSNRDEQIVREYCARMKIACSVKDYNVNETGNFQHLARNFRYEFFKECIQEFNACGVMTAHHADDDLETFIFQQRRGMKSETIGIARETIICDMRVLRPVLDYTKAALEDYCSQHEIAFGLDESNDALNYSRNAIRHELKHMDFEAVEALRNDLYKEKRQHVQYQERVRTIIETWKDSVKIEDYQRFDHTLRIDLLRMWFEKHGINVYEMREKQLDEFDRQILEGQFMFDTESHMVATSYGLLGIAKRAHYEYIYASYCNETTPFFRLQANGKKIEGVTLTENDFPIRIRTPRYGDMIKLTYGTKSLNRFFIDRKIPRFQRVNWPIIENKMGDIVFVSELGCDVHHYSNNPTLFMVKL